MEAARKTLVDLREIVNGAKDRQKAAQAEVKRLEKEMADFKNNKDSNIRADLTGRHRQAEEGAGQAEYRGQESAKGSADRRARVA